MEHQMCWRYESVNLMHAHTRRPQLIAEIATELLVVLYIRRNAPP
jgi:hypothetical protein